MDIVVGGAAFVLVLGRCGSWPCCYWQMKRSKRSDQIHAAWALAPLTRPCSELRLWRDGKEATTLVPAGKPRLSWTNGWTLCQDAGWDIARRRHW